MYKKKLININMSKRDLCQIMSSYADYLEHQPANMTRMMKFTLLATHVLSKMSSQPATNLNIALQMPTIKAMIKSLHWAENRHGYKKADILHSLNSLNKTLTPPSSRTIVYNSKTRPTSYDQHPSFTKKDIPTIALAVRSYIPRLVQLSNGQHVMSLKIILPNASNNSIPDQDSINTIAHAFAYGYRHNWNDFNQKTCMNWMQVWSKVTSLQMFIMHNILKHLDKDVRMAKHSFVKEALDNIFVDLAHNNHDYAQNLLKASVNLHGEHELICLNKTIHDTRHILKHSRETKAIRDNASLLQRFLSRLINMQRRGYHYVIIRDHSLKDFSLRHVQAADVSELVTILKQSL